MAATPKYKIFTPDNEYVASCKYVEDAAALVAFRGHGSTIRTGHSKKSIVYTNGEDGEAGESYDVVADIVFNRECPLIATVQMKQDGSGYEVIRP